jgi:hypothetical protein
MISRNMRIFRLAVRTMSACTCCDRDDKSFQLLTRVVLATGAGFVTTALHALDFCSRCDRVQQEVTRA